MSDERRAVVMVVDDDSGIREVVAEVLRMNGIEVLCAANGREALMRLRYGSRPDIILLDLEMPVMDGWQFRREQLLDEDLADIPLLVASASDPRGVHADGHLKKPYGIDELLAALEAVGAYRRAA